MNRNINKIICFVCATLVVAMGLAGCNSGQAGSGSAQSGNDETTITVFAAKSLNASLDEIIEQYCKANPTVKIQTNYDSSGTLLTQITEGGAACDVFFSAAEKQVNELEKQELIVEGSRANLLKNKMCVVTFKGSNTKVTGLMDMNKATSLAIAGGSVPIGAYTRKALVNTGIIPKAEDEKSVTTEEISNALGGVEINECSNVGAVVAAVSEHSNEVGTVYYSDIAGFEDELEILEMVSTDITGDIIYPVAQVKNADADEKEVEQAGKFIEYLKSDEAKNIFEKHHFEL